MTQSLRGKSSALLAFVFGLGLVACGSGASPGGSGGSGAAAATGGSSGSAGTGTGGTATAGAGVGGSAGTTSASGTGGSSGTNATGGTNASSGTGGGAGAAIGGMSGSSAAGTGGRGPGGAGRGMGGRGAGGNGAAGSAAGGAPSGGLGGISAGGSGGAVACEKGTTKGKDVLLIGDSFIALSHDITKDLIALARADGALAASDSYRDNSVSGTQLHGGISPQIPVQYTNGEKDAPAKVVIMDGGGNDMLNNTCSDPPTASCQAIVDAVQAVKDLLVQMGKDGVETVVYFFYPENQKNATQRAKVDVLRAQLQDVCYSSASPKCYGVDLRPVFDGHFDEYVLSDGIHPTAAGSQASSEAIWGVMKANCIAQ